MLSFRHLSFNMFYWLLHSLQIVPSTSGVAWEGEGQWTMASHKHGLGGLNYQMAPPSPNNETLKNMRSFVGIFYFFAVHAQILQSKKNQMHHSHAHSSVQASEAKRIRCQTALV